MDSYFWISPLVGVESSASQHGRFGPGERAHVTHLIRGWAGPSAGLEEM
jgi:hypothetical protein